MSDASSQPVRLGSFGKVLKKLVVRTWSLAIMLVVAWAAVAAVVYMVRYVLKPAELPAWVRAGRASLQAGVSWSELAIGPATPPAAPLGHYHQMARWFQGDPHNTCTASGCHDALPHGRRKEVRSFANLHASFMDCQLCHDKAIVGQVRTIWVSKATHRPQGPPAVLLLLRQLEVDADKIQKQPEFEHSLIVERLAGVLEETGADPVLKYLLARLQASEPGSPVWRSAVAQLAQELPDHARGEYGAVLSLEKDPAARRQEDRRLAGLAGKFLAAAANSQRRKDLNQQIHEAVLAKPAGCLACHGGEPCRLDYEASGYPPARQAILRNLPVAFLIQQNRQGQPFYLPGVLDQPATQPSR